VKETGTIVSKYLFVHCELHLGWGKGFHGMTPTTTVLSCYILVSSTLHYSSSYIHYVHRNVANDNICFGPDNSRNWEL